MSHLGSHLYSEDSPEIIESATELFEIDDFTSPSPWEKFVSKFEQLLREWNLHKSKKRKTSPEPQWPWRTRNRILTFHNFKFDVTEYSQFEIEQNEDKEENDQIDGSRSWRGTTPDFIHSLVSSGSKEFPWRQAHPIHYNYGLHNFIVLSPSHQEREEIDNETRSKIALSTVAVALSNTNCSVPCFVQVMDRYKDMFNGFSVGGGLRTNYEMIVLKKRPPYCDHLTGLLNLFKTKIRENCDADVELPSVKVCSRFSFILDDWTTYGWSQAPPDLELFSEVYGPEDISQLPFGPIKDPIKELKLHATWYDLPEDIITDNDIHSDLDLMEAPSWAIGVAYEDQPQCLLTDYLKLFNSICDQQATIRQLLGEDMFKEKGDENLDKIPDVFNRLTGSGSGYSLTSMIGQQINRLGRSSSLGGPIKSDHLIRILDYLFPDASEENRHPYPEDLTANHQQFTIKSCPVDGLVWRLSIVFAHCLHILGGMKPLAHLMHEFLMEVRFRYENAIPLPGLPSGSPDHGFCLLHQKLQMVNCCIERKKAREQSKEEKDQSIQIKEPDDTHDDTDDEDLFFDCDDSEEPESIPVWSKDPSGRLKRLGKQRLVHHEEYLYIPICQDPTPLTEDMLAEQAEVMLQLGMDTEGAQLRAKMQSAALLSDMESFKAANPGCVLADFVRWHSPRDWDQDKCKLSPRMEIEGNIWKEAWDNAKPVPAKRQRRLFDDTREAEKVLQYLTNLKPSEAAHLLMPVLEHAAVVRISKEANESIIEDLGQINDIIKDACNKLAVLSRLRCHADVKHFKSFEDDDDGLNSEIVRRTALIQDVIRLIQMAETKISQAISLKTKFDWNFEKVEDQAETDDKEAVSQQMRNFVKDLFSKSEVNAIGAARGPVGQLVTQMFKDAHRASHMILGDESIENVKPFPKPFSREFVLKVNVARPYVYSQPSPQRIYCRLRQNEFRVAGAFTIDQQFM